MKLIIKGQLMGLNEYIRLCRSNKYAAAKAKKDIEEVIMINIKLQLRNFRTDKKIFLKFDWYEKNQKRDLDNIAFNKKFILDSFVKCGTIPNDGWNNIAGFTDRFYIDKQNPRVEVTIELI